MRLNNELLMMQEEFNNYIVYLRFAHDASRDDYILRDINVGFEPVQVATDPIEV